MSAWLRVSANVPGYIFRLEAQWRSGTSVRTTETYNISTDFSTVALVNVAGYTTRGTEFWVRIAKKITVPPLPPVDNLTIRAVIVSTGTLALPPVTIQLEGLMLNQGNDLISYFNGSFRGASWVGTESQSISFNPGAIRARALRQALMDMKRSGHKLYIRNPFGDLWRVHISSMSVSRIAGVGSNEFVDVDIPYMEVAE